MRAKRVRPVYLFALAAAVMLSCRDAAGPIGYGQFALAPSFTSAAAGIVQIARVRVRLFRLDETLALDDTVNVPPGADSLALELTVTLNEPNEAFQMFLEFITANGDTAFRAGPVDVTASSTSTDPVPVEVDALYVGVGANAASVVITTTNPTVLPGQTTLLGAEARDAQDQPIPGTPIGWESRDAARATVPDPATGIILGGTTPGPVWIVATLLTGQMDSVSVDVQPAPDALTKIAGDGQTGPISEELPLPLTVEVTAASSPIEGATVLFTTGDAGTFIPASVVTDASGRAQTLWTLGPGVGPQSATATVSGFPSVTTTFTATAAPGITVSWSNAGGGSWTDPANWTPNRVPQSGDTVVIDLDGTYTVTLASGATIAALTLGGVTGAQTLALASNALGVAGNITVGPLGEIEMNDAQLASSGGVLTLNGVLRGTGGVAVLNAPSVGGVGSSVEVLTGGMELWLGASLAGALDVASGATLTVLPAAAVDLSGSSTVDGTLTVRGTAGVAIGGGTHVFNSGSTVNGAGDFDVVTGSVTVLGAYDLTGITGIVGGSLAFENTTTPAVTSDFVMTGGSLGGAGDLEVLAAFDWAGGTIGPGGQVRIGPSATGDLAIGAKVLDGRTLVNNGTLVWLAGNVDNIDVRNGAAITNGATGTFDVQASDGSVLDNTVGAATLTNDGILMLASDGFVSVNADLVNNGTLDLQTGALDVNGGFTHAAGAVLQGVATLNLVDAAVNALAGDVNPGTSPGVLTVNGDLPLGPQSTINLDYNGLTVGTQYDRLAVTGVLTLDGSINVNTAGFIPQVGDEVLVLSFLRRAGTVAAVNGLDLGGGIVLDTIWNSGDLRLRLPAPMIIFAGDSSGGLSTGIFTVNPDGTALSNPVPMTSQGYQRQFPRWSPDRSRMAYSWDGGAFGPLDLFVANKTGSSVQAVVASDTSTFRPRWSPNGTHLAFECGNGFSIVDVCVIADVTAAIGSLPVNAQTYVTDAAGIPAAWQGGQSGFSWDPQNPDRLVFARDSTGASTVSMLWTAAYDGSGVQRLAPDTALFRSDGAPLIVFGPLDYSPDGQQIAFAAYSPADSPPEDKIFVINRDGTGLRQLTFLAGDDDSPLFSPDGSEVAFGRDRCVLATPVSYEGWIVDINNPSDGSLERQITGHGGVTCDFDLDLLGGDWSPDGSEIVLNGFDATGNLLIYVVPRTVTPGTYPSLRVLVGRGVDGGGFVRDIQPSWRP